MIVIFEKKHSLFFKGSRAGFSVLEFLMVLGIIAILFGVIVAMKTPFEERMALRNSAFALAEDLRLAQSYAMSQADGYEYYGVRFYNNLGVDWLQAGDLRDGWKIVRYEPQGIAAGFDVDALPQPFTIIKTSEFADATEVPDRTFFERGVSFSTAAPISELRPSAAVPPRHSIVFNVDGSATTDGDRNNLLTVTEDQIVLRGFGHTVTMTISALTGHIEIGDVQ